jgi:hypothetical protein
VWVNRSTAFPGGGLEMKIYLKSLRTRTAPSEVQTRPPVVSI